MFQTEINHALQSLASEPLTALMIGVTYLGYGAAFFLLVVIVLFGIDFRRGYVLAHVIIWNSLILFFLKNYIHLPRPTEVDPSLQLLDGAAIADAPMEQLGAPGFWEPLPEDVVLKYRTDPLAAPGFPSGHVSGTIAWWGAASLLFRARWVYGATVALALLMPISRMYLGRHFLADVVGGFFLGLFVMAVAYAAVLRPRALKSYLTQTIYTLRKGAVRWMWTAYLLAVPLLLLPLVPLIHVEDPARLLGLNVAYLLITRKAIPEYSGGVFRAVGRVLVALGLYVAASLTLNRLVILLVGEPASPAVFVAEFFAIFLMSWGGIATCRRLGLGVGV